jgi:tRNA pseudouridine13 synthase
LWGRGALRSAGLARACEEAALAGEEAMRLRAGLETAGLNQERRSLRLRPDGMRAAQPSPDVLELRFSLPPGCYATSVLAEFGAVGAARPLAD